MMKKIVTILFLTGILISFVHAQQWAGFSSLTPGVPELNLISFDMQAVRFEVAIPGIYRTDTVVNGTAFSRLMLPGGEAVNPTGSPEIPVLRYKIAIPICDDIVVSYNIGSRQTLTSCWVYPVPQIVTEENTEGFEIPVEQFTINPAAYMQSRPDNPGSIAAITSGGSFRTQRYVEVTVSPVEFCPVTRTLAVIDQIEITLNFTNPQSDIRQNTGIFNKTATNMFINYEDDGTDALVNDKAFEKEGFTPGSVQYITLTDTAQACQIEADYLILCAEPFFDLSNTASQVNRLANHRAYYNGFDVAILNVEDILSDNIGFYYEGNPDDPDPLNWDKYKKEQRIRTCIRRIYEGGNAAHTRDGKLGYVLLIGDTYESNTGMPTSFDHDVMGAGMLDEQGYCASDYYFSCITLNNQGRYDDTGDLLIGRFSVQSNDHLYNMVEKTIYFETEYASDDWRNGVGFTNGNQCAEVFQNYWPVYYQYIQSLLQGQRFSTVNYCDINGQIGDPTFDYFNSGAFYVQYNGHGWKRTWEHVYDNHFEANLNNHGKTPFVTALACQTGWFDNETCLAEYFTRSSPTMGAVAYIGASRSVWSSGGSLPISETYMSYQECYPYYLFQQITCIAGELMLLSKLKGWGCDNYNKFGYNLFGDPALNLMATGYKITRNTVFSAPTWNPLQTGITVMPGVTLESNGLIAFGPKGSLTVEEGAKIVLGYNVRFFGFDSTNYVKIKGELVTKFPVRFEAYYRKQWQGLILENRAANFDLKQFTFNKCDLQVKAMLLTMDSCNFIDGSILPDVDRLSISNSTFTNGGILTTCTEPRSRSSHAYITGCDIQTSTSGKSGIILESYSSFNITGNMLVASGYRGDGISIGNSGSGSSLHVCLISGNEISGFDYGIKVYGSRADISGNYIYANRFGIGSFNNSSLSVEGDKSALHETATQRIVQNTESQLFSTDNSFPYRFKYNAAYTIPQGNAYYLLHQQKNPPVYDVSYNYWGNRFEEEEAFYPLRAFSYLPVWEFPLPISGSPDENELLIEALQMVESGDYTEAEAAFKSIVSNHSQSVYATEALKQLKALAYVFGNGFTELQQYYVQVLAGYGDSTLLGKLSADLINDCRILQYEYETAAAYLEEKCYSEDQTEALFAAIDLEYVTRLAENYQSTQSKSNKPLTDLTGYTYYKDSLLRQLTPEFTVQNRQEKPKTDPGIISKLYPNPAANHIHMLLETDRELNGVYAVVTDLFGKEVIRISFEDINKGHYTFILPTAGLSNGMYMVLLYADSQLCGMEKLMVME